MKTSDRGIAALVAHEGIVPAPYLDSVDVLTFGIGHTAAAGAPDPAKMPRGMPTDLDAALHEVFAVFRRDLARYEADVVRAVKVPIEQHEFDALLSFHFNTGAIARADLVKALNRGDRHAAASGFMNWRKPAVIIPRRQAEQALFVRGEYPAGRVVVWQVDAGARVIWKAARTLTVDEVLARLRPPEPAAEALTLDIIAARVAALEAAVAALKGA